MSPSQISQILQILQMVLLIIVVIILVSNLLTSARQSESYTTYQPSDFVATWMFDDGPTAGHFQFFDFGKVDVFTYTRPTTTNSNDFGTTTDKIANWYQVFNSEYVAILFPNDSNPVFVKLSDDKQHMSRSTNPSSVMTKFINDR
jgi:hypothetical protein